MILKIQTHTKVERSIFMTFGDKIRKLRKEKKMTQQKLGWYAPRQEDNKK